jgi:DNA sulfur modification protein DndE|tara:strand:- start:793 stop:1218 length:426 start_codon:yes stop_codon:yes gene_type:complete
MTIPRRHQRLILGIFENGIKEMIETVRISEKGKQQLAHLKRKTGIDNWHTLCRWAYCLSLSDASIPPFEEIPTDSNVEMTWKTFSGQLEEVYACLLRQRLIVDGLSEEDHLTWFRIHLHRGISYLNSRVREPLDLCALISN